MRTHFTSQKKALALGVAAVVLTGGAAYAYWTGGGAGTGGATTASGTIALTVNQASLSAMYPGSAAQTLSGTFGNTNAAPVYVTSVTVSITSVVNSSGGTITGCTASDYALTGAQMTVAATVAVGNPVGTWTGATLQLPESGANQDACKGATVNLAYAVV